MRTWCHEIWAVIVIVWYPLGVNLADWSVTYCENLQSQKLRAVGPVTEGGPSRALEGLEGEGGGSARLVALEGGDQGSGCGVY